jgi:predicted DNA-binding transcriptional regulator AlpA
MDTMSTALLHGDAAAQWLGISRRTLDGWRSRAFGPKYLKVGRVIRYRVIDLQLWLQSQERRHTHDTPSGEVQ